MWRVGFVERVGGKRRAKHLPKIQDPNDLIAKYDYYLAIKGVSPGTRDHYRSFLRHLFKSLGLKPDQVAQVTVGQLRSHIVALQERRRKDSTIAKHVSMLKAFFSYALEEGDLETNPAGRLPQPKVAQRLPRALSPEQVRAFFAVIAKGKSERDRRDVVLFHLCYVCGLRIREAASVQRQHLDLESATLRVIGKGDKERVLFVKPKTVELLKEHIARMGVRDFLFPGDEDGHVSLFDLRIEFRSYATDAGLPESITAHVLRHSIAVHYLMGGAPISFVQRLLGHASLAATGIYTRLTDVMAKDIALKTPTAMDSQEEQKGSEALKEGRSQYREPGEWSTWVEIALGGCSR